MLRTKSFGTPVRCRECKHPNLAIDIWCERCGAPLDWKKVEIPANVLHAVPSPATQSAQSVPWPESAAKPVERPPEVHASPAAPPAAPASQFCWSCGARNLAGDGFCSRCGAALGAKPTVPAIPSARRVPTPRRWTLPRLALPALPALTLPRFTLPRLTMPSIAAPRLRLSGVPRTAWVVALVLAVLLIVPLAYLLLPSARPVAGRQPAASHLPSTSGNQAKSSTAESVAIAGVEAKTGLKYSTKCSSTAPCLSVIGQTAGQNAAAFLFSTAHSGGRQCAGYVYQSPDGWHLLSALCGLPGQVAPLAGRDAKVRVPGNCANARSAPSLQSGVVACLYDGTAVHVDGGPTYADSRMWWHVSKGWIAQDFLGAA